MIFAAVGRVGAHATADHPDRAPGAISLMSARTAFQLCLT